VQKISANIKIDRKQIREMKKKGWQTLKIWQTEIERKGTRQKQLDRILLFLKKRGKPANLASIMPFIG
jgi:G:T-mismatch repair DNA endonuclease (very short patch repair protein)